MTSRSEAASRRRISVVLSDVDGTLVDPNKRLTQRALDAVRQLHAHGIGFTITSGRPPFGMRMLVGTLGLVLPLAAFNGGVMLRPDLSIIEERPLPPSLVGPVLDALRARGLDVFVYRTHDWFVASLEAPHVHRETTTIQQGPEVVPDLHTVSGVIKLVGVSDDHARVAAAEAAIRTAFGGRVSAARSQPHYLDVTHPAANKGTVIECLARYLAVPLAQFATLGDQPTDLLMFERSGVSIAMGNASEDVQRRATFVTSSFDEEGFANAIERFILPSAATAQPGSALAPPPPVSPRK